MNSSIPQKLRVDLLIISKNPKLRISDLGKWYDYKKIIFDSSNSTWKVEKWKKECQEMKIRFYSVPDSGAYIEEI
jgi:competence protein ComEC